MYEHRSPQKKRKKFQRTVAEETTDARPFAHLVKPNTRRGKGYLQCPMQDRQLSHKASSQILAPNATAHVSKPGEYVGERAAEDSPWTKVPLNRGYGCVGDTVWPQSKR
jgi:hypothetical protein